LSGTIERRASRPVRVGRLVIGGSSPVSVQSMTKTDPEDVRATLAQVRRLASAGAELVRLTVPSFPAAEAFGRVRAASPVPLVADTHFDPRLAMAALDAGADKVRVNPGTTRSTALRDFARESGRRRVPVRIGVNSGSVYTRSGRGRDLAADMVRAAVAAARRFEDWGQSQIVLSMKAPTVAETVRAYRLAAGKCDYPLHIGVTAAGPQDLAAAKSFAALGALLVDGIGDTLRFSFTGDPVAEVEAGINLLRALGLRRDGPEIWSCPTCGRCRIDLVRLVERVRRELAGLEAPLTVAVMGCVVNGPGEASAADVGLAGTPDGAVLFAGGKRLRRIKGEGAMVAALVAEARKTAKHRTRVCLAPRRQDAKTRNSRAVLGDLAALREKSSSFRRSARR
jgi:(E)-4-hydroxy-3-methylbut-2-enyl-diphosphate synthase